MNERFADVLSAGATPWHLVSGPPTTGFAPRSATSTTRCARGGRSIEQR